jgi:hypothetical protein
MNTQNTSTKKKAIPTQHGEVVELRKLGNGKVQVGIRAIPPATRASEAKPSESGTPLLPIPPVVMQYVEVDENAAPMLGERIDIRFELVTSTPAAG